jgi:hypothetical protein
VRFIVQKPGLSCRQIYRENLGGGINAADSSSPQDIGIGIAIANRHFNLTSIKPNPDSDCDPDSDSDTDVCGFALIVRIRQDP